MSHPHHFQTLSSLRIFLRRGDNRRSGSWWGRLFEKPLSNHLVRSALKSGITHASVHLGHMGFTKDAKTVAYDIGEIPATTLPVCVELVAPKRILEQFVRDEAKHLEGATMLMVDGVHFAATDLPRAAGAEDVHYVSRGAPPPLHVEQGGQDNPHG